VRQFKKAICFFHHAQGLVTNQSESSYSLTILTLEPSSKPKSAFAVHCCRYLDLLESVSPESAVTAKAQIVYEQKKLEDMVQPTMVSSAELDAIVKPQVRWLFNCFVCMQCCTYTIVKERSSHLHTLRCQPRQVMRPSIWCIQHLTLFTSSLAAETRTRLPYDT
jgi:hypothetical protein